MKKVYVITLGHHRDGYNPFRETVFDTYELALAAFEKYKRDDPFDCFIHEKVWANGDKQACLVEMMTEEAYFTETRDMPEAEADVIELLKSYI